MLAVVLEFVDGLVDVGERGVHRALLETLVDGRLPAAAQFLQRADVEVSVVEERFQFRHPARHETAVLADRVAAHRRLARRHVLPEKFANLARGFGFVDRRCPHALGQSRAAVRVAVPFVHLAERCFVLVNREHRPFHQLVERRIRHDDRDFDDAVVVGFEARHLHVEPHEIHVAAHEDGGIRCPRSASERCLGWVENVGHEGAWMGGRGASRVCWRRSKYAGCSGRREHGQEPIILA